MENKNIRLFKESEVIAFFIQNNALIIDAMQQNEIEVKHACHNGVCGICLTPLLKGEIDYASRQPRGLNKKELAQGYFLPCIATCKTDIDIGPPKVKLR